MRDEWLSRGQLTVRIGLLVDVSERPPPTYPRAWWPVQAVCPLVLAPEPLAGAVLAAHRPRAGPLGTLDPLPATIRRPLGSPGGWVTW